MALKGLEFNTVISLPAIEDFVADKVIRASSRIGGYPVSYYLVVTQFYNISRVYLNGRSSPLAK